MQHVCNMNHLFEHSTCHVLQPRRFAAEVQIEVLQIGERADHQKALAGYHITALQVEGSEPSKTCKQCKVELAKHETLHMLQPLPFTQQLMMVLLRIRDCETNIVLQTVAKCTCCKSCWLSEDAMQTRGCKTKMCAR